jgi:glycine oxidase
MVMPPGTFSHVISHEKCYLVPRVDGRVLLGATEEHEAGFDAGNTAGAVAQLIGDAIRMVPAVADARLVRTWAGLRPGTPDRHPFLGPVPGFEGLLAACGHFRTGLVLPVMTGRIIRDLIVGGRTEVDLAPFAVGRKMDV